MKRKATLYPKLLATGVLSSMILGGFDIQSLATSKEDYKSILEYSKAEVANEKSILEEKYQFIPKFIKGKTKLTTFGPDAAKWKTTEDEFTSNTGEVTFMKQYTLTNIKDMYKGQVGVIYKNVGTYKGRQIDLKITLDDWDPYFKKTRYISYDQDKIGHRQTGYTSVKQTWSYIDAKTGKAADMQGSYMNMIDIDSYQGITFDEKTANTIDRLYVTDDSWIQTNKKGKQVELAAPFGNSSNDEDEFSMATVVFNSNSFTFSWDKHYEMSTKYDPDSEVTSNGGLDFFAFTAYKPAVSEVAAPTKLVSDTNEFDSENVTLAEPFEKFTYSIMQNVPNETENYFYSSYSIKDSIPSELEMLGDISVLDETGEDVTSKFENKSSGNNVEMVATDDSLKSASFYEHDYKVTFDTRVKEGSDISKYFNKEKNKFDIPNTATVSINDKEKSSNTVVTHVPVRKMAVEKGVLDADGNMQASKIQTIGENYQYRVEYVIPNTESLTEVTLSDDLEDVIDLKEAKVYDSKTNTDITDQGKITIDDTEESIVWTANEPNIYSGKAINMVITAQIKDDQDLQPYKQKDKIKIPNTANLKINDQTLESNTVTVTPPKNPTVLAPTKSVKDSDERGIQNLLEDRTEAFKYSITHQVAEKVNPFSKYIISDVVPNQLKIENFKVLDSNEMDVTSDFDIQATTENKITATASRDLLRSANFYNNSYTLSFNATIKDDVDLKALRDENDHLVEFTNKADVTVDSDTLDTNTVYTYVQENDEEIEKPTPPEEKPERPNVDVPQTGIKGTGYKLYDFVTNLFK